MRRVVGNFDGDEISFYVSPAGNDGNPGTLAAPFATLPRAQQAVAAIRADMHKDISVYLRGGTYPLTSTLALGDGDSGSNGYYVNYRAYNGEAPVISGGVAITGWTPYDSVKNIWRAPAPSLQTRQLYVNGARATRARNATLPGAVIERITAWGVSYHTTDTSIQGWPNPTEIELAFNGFLQGAGKGGVWTHNRCSVQSVQPATGFGAPFSGDWAPGVGDGIDVVAGDFTGDRKSDMLVHWQSAPATVEYDVFPSAGAVFTAAGNWLPQAGATQRRRVGDFNGDGRDDLLLDYPDPSSPVGFRHAVELSNGASGFGAPGSGYWAQGAGDGIDVVVGDFNGDRKSDLLIYWQDPSAAYRYDVFLSNGADFVYSANWVPGAGASKRRIVGDFNGDGRDDLMLDYPDASLPTGFRHQVLMSTGASFSGPGSGAWLQGAGDGIDVVSGDFNGDHKSDVLIYWQSGASTYRYDVSLSNGSDFVYSGGWLAFGPSKRRIVGDYDGDGIDDLMVDAFDGANVLHHRVFLSDGGQGTNITLKGCRFRPYGLPDFVDNAMAWLDAPGEWYHDVAAGYLYYIPRPGETMASAEVIAPRLEKLVEATGAHHIQLTGLTFAYATWLGPNGNDGLTNLQADSIIKADGTSADIQGNVAMHGVYGMTFERDVFTHLGGTGLTFDGASRYVLVRGNRMFDISGSGVRLGAFQSAVPDPAAQDNHFYIADNYVHDVAVEYLGSVGVLSGYTFSTAITHNELANLPYSGISLGWGWGSRALTSGNEISFNHIHDVVRTLSDGGAIYTNGILGTSWSDATRVTGNYVHDQVNDYGLLYHDDGSTWIETSSNVIGAGRQYWIVLKNAHLSIHDNYTSLTAMLNMTGPNSNGTNTVDVTLSNNQTGLSTWPSAATAVIGAAGLEPAYRDLLN